MEVTAGLGKAPLNNICDWLRAYIVGCVLFKFEVWTKVFVVVIDNLDEVVKISTFLKQENVLYYFLAFACPYLVEQLLHLTYDGWYYLAVEIEVSAMEIILSFIYHLHHSEHQTTNLQLR